MNAETEIKKQILIDLRDCVHEPFDMPSDENIDEFYEDMQEGEFCDEIYDGANGFRSSGEDTDLKPESYSRHYECKQVARVLDSGKCVSWTYWYGGGKHGEPEGIDWMDEAFFVNVKQETKVINIFSPIEEAA